MKKVVGYDGRTIRFRNGVSYFTIKNPAVVYEMLKYVGYEQDKDGYSVFKIKRDKYNLNESINLAQIVVENRPLLNEPKEVEVYENRDASFYIKLFTEINYTDNYVEYRLHPFLMDMLSILRDYFIKIS